MVRQILVVKANLDNLMLAPSTEPDPDSTESEEENDEMDEQ